VIATAPTSIEGIVYVEHLRGADAAPDAAPDLLVEVPHGADRRAHYDALRTRLKGELPADLNEFFSMNTDVGAWAYGRATAQAIVDAQPDRSALLLRCLLPRTFVDCNRPADFEGTQLNKGGLTAGIPAYVRDGRDHELLLDLHRRYLRAAQAAYRHVVGRGGLALVPHTYGPRSLGIDKVDDEIVAKLRWATEPERHEAWPMRAEIDLLTRDGDGELFAPAGVEEALLSAFERAGFEAKANDTYYLHPAGLGHTWSTEYPGRVVCLEVRRDLLVDEWRWNEEMLPVDEKVARVARVLAPVLAEALPR
jgi:hypothetical protein